MNSLAASVKMSSSRFAREFKLTTGQSPHKWVMVYRMKQAKELLANTDQSIVQIALDCGFSGQSYMKTVFSKALGGTPKCYRQLLT